MNHLYKSHVDTSEDFTDFRHEHDAAMKGVKPAPVSLAIQDQAAKTESDFFQCLLEEGGMYTYNAEDEPLPGLEDEHTYHCGFEVVVKNPHNVKTLGSPSFGSMRVPIVIQRFMVCGDGGASPAILDRLEVSPQGQSESTDAASIVPFKHAWASMRRWTDVSASPNLGCSILAKPYLLMQPPFPMLDDRYPVVLMLKDLRRLGYSKSTDIGEHVPGDGQLSMAMSNPVGRKSYYRCLLAKDELFEQGATEIVTKQLEGYYRLLLRSKDKSNVQPKQSAKEYNLALEDVKDPSVFRGRWRIGGSTRHAAVAGIAADPR